MSLRLTALAAALLIAGSAHAAGKIKVGLVFTLSGPGASLGADIHDGFQLGMKHLNGKLGNLPADVLSCRRPAKPGHRQASRPTSC